MRASGSNHRLYRVQQCIKRVFDLLLAFLLLIFLSPLLFGSTLAIYLSMGLPIVFRQVRPGFREKPFSIIKFRTMREDRDSQGNLLPDRERMTWVGSLLRKLSFDELPQLISVIKGDLSLIGPRPLLMDYLPLYNSRQKRRHDVPPGVSGWAQVNGRNNLTWQEKFELDIWYVENWSLWLDVKIFFLTIFKIFAREGVSQKGHVTMEPFKGNPTP